MFKFIKKLIYNLSDISLNICPDSDYSEHMPRGTASQRINQHFNNSFNYLNDAIYKFENNNKDH